MIKSIFRINSYLMAVFDFLIAVILTVFFLILIIEKINKTFILDNGLYITLACIILALGLRIQKKFTTRAIFLKLEDEFITMKYLLGYGSRKQFRYNEFEGFSTVTSSSIREDSYETLFLIRNGRKTIIVDEFYQKNYTEIKQFIETKTKWLGVQSDSLIQELKDEL